MLRSYRQDVTNVYSILEVGYMPKKPRLSVEKETSSGLNTHFHDNQTGQTLTRGQVAKEIRKGTYDDYHVRKVNGQNIIASNPDKSKRNNLG